MQISKTLRNVFAQYKDFSTENKIIVFVFQLVDCFFKINISCAIRLRTGIKPLYRQNERIRSRIKKGCLTIKK